MTESPPSAAPLRLIVTPTTGSDGLWDGVIEGGLGPQVAPSADPLRAMCGALMRNGTDPAARIVMVQPGVDVEDVEMSVGYGADPAQYPDGAPARPEPEHKAEREHKADHDEDTHRRKRR